MITKLFLKLTIPYKRKLFSSWSKNPKEIQKKVLLDIIKKNQQTEFGKKHNFQDITDHSSFIQNVPIHHYHDYLNYLEQEFKSKNILTSESYKYIAFNSMTTDASLRKALPYTLSLIKANLKFSFLSMIHSCDLYGKDYFKHIFYLTGNPALTPYKGKLAGMVSAIYKHRNPQWLESRSYPSRKVSSIEDFPKKVMSITEELNGIPLKMICGTPPWFVYPILKLKPQEFKDLDLVVYGGSSIGTYKNKLNTHFNRELNYFETYATTEGYIGFQYKKNDRALILNIDGNIFFEFIKLEDYKKQNYKRYPLWEVELNCNYVVVITNSSGLYGYVLGDIVRFCSNSPYQCYFVGRTKHEIQSLYEKDLCDPIYQVIENKPCYFDEFAFSQSENKTYLIAQITDSNQLLSLKKQLDQIIEKLPIKVTPMIVKSDSFYKFMEKNHRVGGQFKISKLDPEGSLLAFLKDFKLELDY